jgi:hypothetical protein
MSFRTIDFPAPLAPSRIAMLAFGTLKLISLRTTWSSKAKDTLSNTTASDSSLWVGIGPVLVYSR